MLQYIKKYVTMMICLMSNNWWYENQCALEASLNKTNFPFCIHNALIRPWMLYQGYLRHLLFISGHTRNYRPDSMLHDLIIMPIDDYPSMVTLKTTYSLWAILGSYNALPCWNYEAVYPQTVPLWCVSLLHVRLWPCDAPHEQWTR